MRLPQLPSVATALRRFVALLVFSASGCAVVGIAADRLAGPASVMPKYTFGPTTPVLVLVENYRDPSANASDAQRVARMVGEVLTQRNAAMIISPEKLTLVRDGRPGALSKMTVVEIGKAVGAHQVLYIDMGGVAVGAAQGSDILKGIARGNAKVIDVSTGQVAFPGDMADGFAVEFTSPMRRASGEVTPATVRGEALVGLSSDIARLFYEYQPGDMEALDTGL